MLQQLNGNGDVFKAWIILALSKMRFCYARDNKLAYLQLDLMNNIAMQEHRCRTDGCY